MKQTNPLLKIGLFLTFLIVFYLIGYFVVEKTIGSSKFLANLIIQVTSSLLVLILLSLSFVTNEEFRIKSIINEIKTWSVIFIPTVVLGLQLPYNNSFSFLNYIFFWLAVVIWGIFFISFASDINRKIKIKFINSQIVFSSIWLLIGFIDFSGNNRFFNFSIKPLHDIVLFQKLSTARSLFLAAIIVYTLGYIFYHIGDEKKPIIFTIPSIKKKLIFKNDIVNGFMDAIKFISNILIDISNPILQVVGTILVYFFVRIPKILKEFILEFGKLSLLQLPGIAIILLILSITYGIREISPEIINYLQSSTGNNLGSLKLISLFGFFTTVEIIIIGLLYYYSFNPNFIIENFYKKNTTNEKPIEPSEVDEKKNINERKFNLNQLPFGITLLLFLLTITGWILSVAIKNYHLGYFALAMTFLLMTGALIMLFVNLNTRKIV